MRDALAQRRRHRLGVVPDERVSHSVRREAGERPPDWECRLGGAIQHAIENETKDPNLDTPTETEQILLEDLIDLEPEKDVKGGL
jgi:hypothetical protein